MRSFNFYCNSRPKNGYTAAYQALLVIGEASKSLPCTTLGSKLRQPNNFLKEEIKS